MSRLLIFGMYVAVNALGVWLINSEGKVAFFQCYCVGAALLTHYLSNRGGS